MIDWLVGRSAGSAAVTTLRRRTDKLILRSYMTEMARRFYGHDRLGAARNATAADVFKARRRCAKY